MNEISPIDFFKYYQNNLNFKIIDIRSTNESLMLSTYLTIY